MNPATFTDKDIPGANLVGKWIIITGSNNGIGFETAQTFAKWGANLILACRDPPAREIHPNEAVKRIKQIAEENGHQSTIEWWKIDMANFKSIEDFAQRWLEADRPLDILCNNAGIAAPPTGHRFTADGFEFIHQVGLLKLMLQYTDLTFQVNLLSHVLLTLRLLPSIARSPEPRIICTTSCTHHTGILDLKHFDCGPDMRGRSYANNKLYYQMWIAELQSRFLKHPEYLHITINGVHPGFVASGIWNALKSAGIMDGVLKFLLRFLAIDPKQGSYSIANAATHPVFGPDPKTQGAGAVEGRGGGKYINRIWEAPPKVHVRDPEARAAVWKKLNEELDLQEKGLLAVLGL